MWTILIAIVLLATLVVWKLDAILLIGHRFKIIPREVTKEFITDVIMFKMRMRISASFEIGHLVKSRSGTSDLVYYDGFEKYIIRYPKQRGPYPSFRSVIATTQYSDDPRNTGLIPRGGKDTPEGTRVGGEITETIRKYAGPHANFYGIPTTPSMFGVDELQFLLDDGSEHIFLKHDIIQFGPSQLNVINGPSVLRFLH